MAKFVLSAYSGLYQGDAVCKVTYNFITSVSILRFGELILTAECLDEVLESEAELGWLMRANEGAGQDVCGSE